MDKIPSPYVGEVAAKLLDRIDEFEGPKVEVAVMLASIRLNDGTRRVELVYCPGDDATAADILRPALATLEHGIGERRHLGSLEVPLEDDDG
jgi:hypothetical protein